jgi:hypothetical protein
MDNLNIHELSCRYEAFTPDEASRLVERVEVHHTPKHGSRLNVAEIPVGACMQLAAGPLTVSSPAGGVVAAQAYPMDAICGPRRLFMGGRRVPPVLSPSAPSAFEPIPWPW